MLTRKLIIDNKWVYWHSEPSPRVKAQSREWLLFKAAVLDQKVHWLDGFLIFPTWRNQKILKDYRNNFQRIASGVPTSLAKLQGLECEVVNVNVSNSEFSISLAEDVVPNICEDIQIALSAKDAFLQGENGWPLLAKITRKSIPLLADHIADAVTVAVSSHAKTQTNQEAPIGDIEWSMNECRERVLGAIVRVAAIPPHCLRRVSPEDLRCTLHRWVKKLRTVNGALKVLHDIPIVRSSGDDRLNDFSSLLNKFRDASEPAQTERETKTTKIWNQILVCDVVLALKNRLGLEANNDDINAAIRDSLVEIVYSKNGRIHSTDQLERQFEQIVKQNLKGDSFNTKLFEVCFDGTAKDEGESLKRAIKSECSDDRTMVFVEEIVSKYLDAGNERLAEVEDKVKQLESKRKRRRQPKQTREFDPRLRCELFVGRGTQLRALDEWTRDPRPKRILVQGPSGTGKSTLLIRWAESELDENVIVISHFLSPFNAEERTERDLLEHTCRQFARVYNNDEEMPHDIGGLRGLYSQYINRPPPKRTRIVVLIDGLDEALPQWEPHRYLCELPKHGRVSYVLSARTMGDKDWKEVLSLTEEDKVLELGGISVDEIRQFLEEKGMPTGTDDRERATERIFEVSQGDPFYLQELLQLFVEHDGRIESLNDYPIGFNAYLHRWWVEGCESCLSYGPTAFADLMTLLALAQRPLSRDELLDLHFPTITSATFRALLQAASRCVRGDVASGYIPAHRRIVEFTVLEMRRDLSKYQESFAQLGLKWSDTSLAERSIDYAIRFGIRHILEQRNPDYLLRLMTMKWVQHKCRHCSFGAVSEDMKLVLRNLRDCRSDPTILAILVRVGLFKRFLASRQWDFLLAAELVVRARLGNTLEVMSDARDFGSKADRILVLGECGCALWDVDRPQAVDVLKKLKIHASESVKNHEEADALEHVCIRLAAVSPKEALKLAALLDNMESCFDYKKCERGNRSRCVFKIFQELAMKNMVSANTLVDALSSNADRVTAFLAIITVQVHSGDMSVGKTIRKLLNLFKDRATAAIGVLSKYLLLLVIRSRRHDFVAILDEIDRAVGVVGMLPLDYFDNEIESDSKRWLEEISRLKDGDIKSFLSWRIAVLGLGQVDPTEFQSEEYRDFVRATMLRGNLTDDRNAVDSNLEAIRTPSGQIAAASVLMQQVALHDVRAAKLMAWQIVEELMSSGVGALLSLGADAIRSMVQHDIESAQRVISECRKEINAYQFTKDLPDVKSQRDAKYLLGRIIGSAFAGSVSQSVDRLGTLFQLMNDPRDRELLIEYATDFLPLPVCREIAPALVLDVTSAINRALLPHELVLLGAELAKRLLPDDLDLFDELIEYASEVIQSVPEGVERNWSSSVLIDAALHRGVKLAWVVFKRTKCAHHIFTDSVTAFLESDRRSQCDRVRAWTSHGLRMLMTAEEVNTEGLDTARLFVEVAHFGNHAPLCLKDEPRRQMFSPNEILEVVESYIEYFSGSEGDSVNVYPIVQSAAEHDWNVLRKAVDNDRIAGELIHIIDEHRLTKQILSQDLPPEQLLSDIDALREARLRRIGRRDETTEFYATATAAAASLAPDLSLKFIKQSNGFDVVQFTSGLKYLGPKTPWSSSQVEELLSVIGQHTASIDDVRIHQTKFLVWLCAHDRSHWPSIERMTTRLSEIRAQTLVTVAESIAKVDQEQSLLALQEALSRSAAEKDTCAYVHAAAALTFNSRGAKNNAEAENVADLIDENADAFGDIRSALQARVLLDDILNRSSYRKETLVRLFQLADVSTEQSFLDWIALLRNVESVDDDCKSQCLDILLDRVVSDGAVISTSAVDRISDWDTRIKVLLRMSRIDAAIQMAESVPTMHAQARAYELIAKQLSDIDAQCCMDLCWRAAKSASTQSNETVFTSYLGIAAEQCLISDSHATIQIARDLYDLVDQYPFGKANPRVNWSRAYALFFCGMAAYGGDHELFVRCVKEGITACQAKHGEFGLAPMAFVRGFKALLKTKGMDAAKSYIDQIRHACDSDESFRNLADGMSKESTYSTKTGQPLSHLSIWRHSPSDEQAALLRVLLPHNSHHETARAAGALAIAEVVNDSKRAATYVADATATMVLNDLTFDRNEDDDVWLIQLAFGSEVIREGIEALERSESSSFNAEAFMFSLLEQSPCKPEVLDKAIDGCFEVSS